MIYMSDIKYTTFGGTVTATHEPTGLFVKGEFKNGFRPLKDLQEKLIQHQIGALDNQNLGNPAGAKSAYRQARNSVGVV